MIRRIFQFIFRRGRYAHRPYCPYRYEGNRCTCKSKEVA